MGRCLKVGGEIKMENEKEIYRHGYLQALKDVRIILGSAIDRIDLSINKLLNWQDADDSWHTKITKMMKTLKEKEK